MNPFLEQYLPILMFLCIALGVSLLMVTLSKLLSPHRPSSEKNSAYECGIPAFSDARMKFDVSFYLVAILFIIFDLEIAFLFPWALCFQELSWGAFGVMMTFLGILGVGFIYEWKKGALEWE